MCIQEKRVRIWFRFEGIIMFDICFLLAFVPRKDIEEGFANAGKQGRRARRKNTRNRTQFLYTLNLTPKKVSFWVLAINSQTLRAMQ